MKIGLLPLRVKDDIKLVPSGLMYIASYLEKYSEFNNVFLELNPYNVLEKKPDVVAIGSVTQTFTEATRIAKEIKNISPKTMVFVGGPHISAMPHTLPTYFDAGVMGEGEEVMLELLQTLKKGEFNPDGLKKIDGVVFHDDQGNKIINRRKPWIEDLDLIPPPKRSLIDNLAEKLQQSLLTARGCSFKCRYCASTQFWEKIRFHSAERVVEEITQIIKAYPNQKNITINDDLFTANVKRLRKIVELVREAGIHKKVTFACSSRASVFNEEICELLMKMNVNYIIFGFESASDKILSYLKGSTKSAQNRRAVEICRKFGIAAHGNFIFGSPVETLEDAATSYWFARGMKDLSMNYSIAPATPFPGTSFWEYCTEKGIIDKESFEKWHDLSLNWNPEQFYFMNENYSKTEFIDLMNKLMQLKINKNVYDVSQKFGNYKGLINYYRVMNELVIEKINADPQIKKVLEFTISRAVSEPEIILRPEINQNKIPISQTQSQLLFENDQSDTVVFNHSLEYIRNPDKIMKKLSKFSNLRKIIIVCYNSRHISLLIDLLYGDWSTYQSGIDNEARLNHYDQKSLTKLLEKHDFRVTEIENNYGKVEKYIDTYKILLENFSDRKILKKYILESDIPSFLLIAEKNLTE